MANLGHFDPNTVEPAQDFDPIPSGEYVAIITDSDLKHTKNGAGQYLELAHQIIDGEFKGRLVWARLNIQNSNEIAQRIAQQQLSAICHAIGLTQAISDSEQLHNRPLVIRVAYLPADDAKGYRAKNDIKAWKALDNPAPAAAAAAKPPAAPAPATQRAPVPARAAPPWATGAAR